MARVYLGLGSNQTPYAYLASGLAALGQQYQIMAESPWYLSPAVGFDGPDFINLAIVIETDMPLLMLSRQLKQLEQTFGRPDDAVKFSSRNLDVDILLYDDLAGQFDSVSLPRRDIYQYAFVLRPLLDLEPDLRCPDSGRALSEWWPGMSDQTVLPVAQPAVMPEAPMSRSSGF